MQQFKVITLSIGGHSNRIFESQDIVTAADFPSEENVLQHVLTGGLNPLNEDGTEMERVVITQEMLDGMTYEQTQAVKASGIVIRSGMYTYKGFAELSSEPGEETPEVTMEKHIVTEEDLVNNPEMVEQGLKVGDEIEIPAPVVEPTETKKTTAKKSTAKK